MTALELEAAEQTWTFVGHWEGSEIVVEYALPGVVDDTRVDRGYWSDGLWAAAGSGATMDEAEAGAKAEYEHEHHAGPGEPTEGCPLCAEEVARSR